ncbi:electron transfer flavoprotein subunit beta/FixA family protein [Flindersiella endophytica]
MKIVVCVKYVPDAAGERGFDSADNTVDRSSNPGILSELDEHAIEAALQLAEAKGDTQVVALTVGPDGATDAIKKALQLGADAGVHLVDDAVHGSDAVGTSLVLARALEKYTADEGPVDLVLCGMASTDGGMSVVPTMLAERLGLPAVTFAAEVEVGDGTVRVRRDGEAATETIEASLPALVSVTDQANEPRYAAFKNILAAKKKPVTTWALADVGVEPSEVGLGAAWTAVESFEQRPPRQKGTIVTDEGDAGAQLVAFLAERKFV